jgi:hypothetical protein
MSKAVMQLALDALIHNYPTEYRQEVVEKLRAELAKPEPEPIMWLDNLGNCARYKSKYAVMPLYRKEEM